MTRRKSLKYKSIYTDRLVCAADYVAQKVCENLAQKEHEELPKKFWNISSKWKREFRRQQNMARQLVELYTEEVVVQMMNFPNSKKIISLYAEFSYMPLLHKAQDEIKKKKNKISKLTKPVENVIITIEPPRPSIQKTNRLSRLRELDGTSEEK